MLILLVGCALFDTSATDQRILDLTDQDGDGYTLEADCNDADPSIYPDAPEVCDGKNNDCDGATDEDGGGTVWCRDEDGDGHGDPATQDSACNPPTTAVTVCDDCDDRALSVFPGASERCDGIDDDCDGITDPATNRSSRSAT